MGTTRQCQRTEGARQRFSGRERAQNEQAHTAQGLGDVLSWKPQTLVLQHEPWLRHAGAVGMFAIFGGLPILVTAQLSAVSITTRVIVGLCFAAMGGYLGMCAERAIVICRPDEILIRGFVRTRRIRATGLIGLQGIHLYWCGRRGRLRRSRLASFATSFKASDAVYERNHSYLAELRHWIDLVLGTGLERRTKTIQHLDEATLARELQRAETAAPWEHKHITRWTTRTPWQDLKNAATTETARRARKK